MSIYDINYSTLGSQLLPPDKRSKNLTAFVGILLSPVKWLRDLWFGTYRTGASYAQWAIGTTYAKYDRVIYKKAVYESKNDGNVGYLPTVAAHWQQVQANFIGLSERVMYNGQCLVLTWALNKWFGTSFVQPPNTGSSDIYISNNTIPASVFVAGADGNSSYVFTDHSPQYVINDYTFAMVTNFTINVPSAVYAALSDTDAKREAIFRAFVNQYVPAGILYTIQTY